MQSPSRFNVCARRVSSIDYVKNDIKHTKDNNKYTKKIHTEFGNLSFTLVKVLIKYVVATPNPKNNIYEKYFIGRPLRFFNNIISKFVFFSEYGGYRDLVKYF